MNSRKLSVWLVLLVICGLSACGQPEREPAAPTPFESPSISPQAFESPPVSPQAFESSPVQFEGVIAFHSKRSSGLQIYLLYGDTGEIERLTTDPFGAFEPSWSPDCGSIVFASGRDSQSSFEIYTMLGDGTEQTRLFEHQPEDDWAPAWSPNGDVIAYQTNPRGRFNICYASVDGEQLGCMEDDSNSNNGSPNWSPDGNQVLFTSDRDGDWEVYLVDAQGDSAPVQLTHNDYTEKYPQFSPDGQYIAFSSQHDDNFDIFTMKADGSDEVQLTTHSADDVSPRWVGNEKLAFASQRSLINGSPDWDLYLMDRDGQNVTQLTHVKGLDKWPVWCSSTE